MGSGTSCKGRYERGQREVFAKCEHDRVSSCVCGFRSANVGFDVDVGCCVFESRSPASKEVSGWICLVVTVAVVNVSTFEKQASRLRVCVRDEEVCL